MIWLFREPQQDPELGSALRQLEGASPRDLASLQQQIVAAATPQLAALRSRSPRWWEWISRWMPVAVPVGIAASIAAGLLLPEIVEPGLESSYSSEVGADSTLFIAAYSEGRTGSQLAGSLVAPESGDWLLQEALSQ